MRYLLQESAIRDINTTQVIPIPFPTLCIKMPTRAIAVRSPSPLNKYVVSSVQCIIIIIIKSAAE